MTRPETLPEQPVVQDTYRLGGAEHSTVSSLDGPMTATPQGQQYVLNRGDTIERFLPALRYDCLTERAEIMAIPSEEEGLDMERVRAFVGRYGAPQKAVRVLSPAQYRKAHDVRIVTSRFFEDSQGVYRVAPDLALVERDPAREARFGATHTEAVIIHELLGHGWSTPQFDGFVHMHGDYLKSGFNGPTGNSALEEGWAIYVEAMYRQEYGVTPGATYNRFAPGLMRTLRLGEVSGRWVKYEMVSAALADGTRPEEATNGFGPSTYAASILERFIERDPEFLGLLCEARTSTEALAQVRERLNRVRPNLYETLLDTRPYEEQSRWDLKALDTEIELRLAKLQDKFDLALGLLALRGRAAWERYEGKKRAKSANNAS